MMRRLVLEERTVAQAVEVVMGSNRDTVYEFDLDGFAFRTMSQWRETVKRQDIPARYVQSKRAGNFTRPGFHVPATAIVQKSSPMATARRYAEAHGIAGVWRADDSMIVFTLVGDRVQQKTYRHARPRRSVSL